jgi:hypothetical protein
VSSVALRLPVPGIVITHGVCASTLSAARLVALHWGLLVYAVLGAHQGPFRSISAAQVVRIYPFSVWDSSVDANRPCAVKFDGESVVLNEDFLLVRRAQASFIRDKLGIQTDYACV